MNEFTIDDLTYLLGNLTVGECRSKIVLVDSDNYETEIDGIYFDENENKLYINSSNGCNYSNIFRTLYRKEK